MPARQPRRPGSVRNRPDSQSRFPLEAVTCPGLQDKQTFPYSLWQAMVKISRSGGSHHAAPCSVPNGFRVHSRRPGR